MQTHLIVFITAHEMDVRDYRVFERCAEFARYEATIHLRVVDIGLEMQYTCSHEANGPHCWGWRYFREEWIRRHGPI